MIVYDAIKLFDLGFGPRMVPVTPPDCAISPSSSLLPKHRGKAPGVLTPSGWTSLDVNNVKFRCLDYQTAKLWDETWGANVGFAAGDGYVIVDNDQGREFSGVLRGLLPEVPRRFVQEPRHERDAFLVRVIDFIGDGARVANQELKFRNGVRAATVQILARGKQAVIAGIHPETRSAYCWDRELMDLENIPTLSEDDFLEIVRKFIARLRELSWISERSTPTSPVSAAQPNVNTSTPGKFTEARALLAQIPNREVPPGETPTSVDNWLDDYANWVSVAYALIAFLGRDAMSPEAQEIWLEWSDGRPQASQTSLSVWRSALNQDTRFQSLGLIKLVRSLVSETPNFPDDIDPDDPSMNVPPPDPPPPPAPPTIMGKFINGWAFCAIQRGFVEIAQRRVIRPAEFSMEHAKILPALRRELGLSRRNSPNVAGALLAQTNPGLLRALDITYAPGEPSLIAPNGALPIINFWRPAAITAMPVSDAQIKPWLDHLLFVLGSPAERARFLRWCAFVVQYPGKKPNWHYLLMSKQGLGKDTMLAPLKMAVGDDNWREASIYALTGNFDYALETKLLIFGETGQPQHAQAHVLSIKLKPLLARPPLKLSINKKNMHPYDIPNALAVILFSNESNPLYLEREQRRVHVVNRLGVAPQTLDYYAQLHAWFDAGGAIQCAAYLMNYPLSNQEQLEFIGGVAPSSNDKNELEGMNVHPQLTALEELIQDARDGIKSGTPYTLVATAGQLAQMIVNKGLRAPAPKQVSQWLLEMERDNKGVQRGRSNALKPTECLPTQGLGHKERLWFLADTTADGRLWNSLTNEEIIAIWANLPAPKNATVTPFPQKPAKDQFPDDGEDMV